MGLTLMNRLNRKGGQSGDAGGGEGNGRNARITVTMAKAAQKMVYKICGRKGGLS